jgi:hypothetical protein
VNFKPSGIEKYDGSTNPAEWVEVYQLAIEAVGGDSYVMMNYMSICLSSYQLTIICMLWPSNHLSWLSTSNFCATCAWLGVDSVLASIVKNKGESLQEYIQRFCNKWNIIPEVDNMSIMMFFKKGLRDSSLIQKVTMKNRSTSEQMFSISNRYAVAEEATLHTRE